jgi:hypothetical protein
LACASSLRPQKNHEINWSRTRITCQLGPFS